jgi:hypothetical protein
MKNIHLIPTDKPSMLWMTKLGNLTRCHDIRPIKEALGNNVNIYITNDKEIKEGDYYYNERLNQVFQAIRKSGYNTTDKEFKVILTTNKSLIKDGLQTIDDEFLEWFCSKNGKVDFVKIVNDVECLPMPNIHINKHIYKIIIPQEEPKQETLEEFIKKYQKNKTYWNLNEKNDTAINIRIGAKWQQKRMYSEEEVEDLIYKVCGTVARLQGITLNGNHIDTAYKKFKKK